jgi:LuxR family maltose regulon positive regulatory protein
MNPERRRFMRLADRARAKHPERFGAYEACLQATVRAAAIDDGVSEAVAEGYRAVELAQTGVDDVSVGAFAGLARALYFSGDAEQAWTAASRGVAHPEAARRAPEYAVVLGTLALAAVELDRLGAARRHAEAARGIVGRITSGRSWLGANAAAALGAVLAAERNLAGAEREFSYAERLVGDEVATIEHAWVLVRLADARCRRGRLDDAESTLRRAREELAALPDSGLVPQLADGVGRALEEARRNASCGDVLERPSEAELAVLRLLATDLSTRGIGAVLFLSPNTVRSHVRAIYRKLGVGDREAAVARASTMGLLVERNHSGDRRKLA